MCSEIGATPDFNQSVSYIASWIEALQNDKKFIFKAAAAAQKSTDFILQAAGDKEQTLAA